MLLAKCSLLTNLPESQHAHLLLTLSYLLSPDQLDDKGREGELVKFPLRETERERQREREIGEMVSEGTSCRQEVGGLPLASATVFSTSAADYKQKTTEKNGLALCKRMDVLLAS